MPTSPLGHNNFPQRRFTAGTPQESQAMQDNPDTQPASEEQARAESADAEASTENLLDLSAESLREDCSAG